LESESKTAKMRGEMLENILREDQNKAKGMINPNDLASFRILNEENKQLKELIKHFIENK
jgi:hypothetical protein